MPLLPHNRSHVGNRRARRCSVSPVARRCRRLGHDRTVDPHVVHVRAPCRRCAVATSSLSDAGADPARRRGSRRRPAAAVRTRSRHSSAIRSLLDRAGAGRSRRSRRGRGRRVVDVEVSRRGRRRRRFDRRRPAGVDRAGPMTPASFWPCAAVSRPHRGRPRRLELDVRARRAARRDGQPPAQPRTIVEFEVVSLRVPPGSSVCHRRDCWGTTGLIGTFRTRHERAGGRTGSTPHGYCHRTMTAHSGRRAGGSRSTIVRRRASPPRSVGWCRPASCSPGTGCRPCASCRVRSACRPPRSARRGRRWRWSARSTPAAARARSSASPPVRLARAATGGSPRDRATSRSTCRPAHPTQRCCPTSAR